MVKKIVKIKKDMEQEVGTLLKMEMKVAEEGAEKIAKLAKEATEESVIELLHSDDENINYMDKTFFVAEFIDSHDNIGTKVKAALFDFAHKE